VSLENAPRTNPTRQIKKDHRVGTRQPNCNIGDPTVDDPGLASSNPLFKLQNLILRHRVSDDGSSTYDLVLTGLPPESV
jgi:hypothetical protein